MSASGIWAGARNKAEIDQMRGKWVGNSAPVSPCEHSHINSRWCGSCADLPLLLSPVSPFGRHPRQCLSPAPLGRMAELFRLMVRRKADASRWCVGMLINNKFSAISPWPLGCTRFSALCCAAFGSTHARPSKVLWAVLRRGIREQRCDGHDGGNTALAALLLFLVLIKLTKIAMINYRWVGKYSYLYSPEVDFTIFWG